MVALAIEFSCVVIWFLWMYRRQERDRDRARRVPLTQLELIFKNRRWRRRG